MSKFFQSNTSTEIDDNDYSYLKTWSSNRISTEVENLKPKLKLGELNDVDTNGVNNDYVIAYSGDSTKYITASLANLINSSISNIASSFKYEQIEKLNCNGTSVSPEIVNIPLQTTDFRLGQVNLLKQDYLNENVPMVLTDFNSGDKSNYLQNDFIIFDGNSKLETSYNEEMINVTSENSNIVKGSEWTCEIDKSIFNSDYESYDNFKIDDSSDSINLTYNAIPKNRLLIQNIDYNLSLVGRLKTMTLTGTGNNIKIVSSINNGTTWQYFDINTGTFKDLGELNETNINQYGNTIIDFNSINRRWNYIIGEKKIRFAYLMNITDFNDVESLDKLELTYDANLSNVWSQEKESNYDVKITNTEIKVYIYTDGNFKINYGVETLISNPEQTIILGSDEW